MTTYVACCKVCGAVQGLRRCSRCRSVYYCSEVHQQVDWRVHKIECKKYLAHNSQSPNYEQYQQNEVTTNQIPPVQMGQSQQRQQQQPQLFQSAQMSPQSSQLFQETGMNHSQIPQAHTSQTIVEPMMVDSTESSIASSSNVNNIDLQKYDEFKRMKENSVQISNINIMENSLTPSDMKYDALCKQIINDMNTYGMCVVDDFLGNKYGLDILREVHGLYEAGLFQNGQVVSNTDKDVKKIRGDKITWVKGTEPHCTSIGFLINQIDNVVISANKMRNNGLLGEYKIRERTKAMIACYPSTGSHYILHVDNPNRDGRCVTAIYYLNMHWDSQRSGGALRIFPESGSSVAEIEPKFDRIIFFWSDRRNPHEVQPSHRTRYAITVWYFDADERELALQHRQSATKPLRP